MNRELQTKNGFSLTEVLLAIGILSIGMIFIAGVFPAAIYLTTVSTEQSIAAAAADEAFAKIRLYDVNWADSNFAAGQTVPVEKIIKKMNIYEFLYPSIGTGLNDKQYYWSALCRQTAPRDVQVTVFVCRKVGSNWQVPVRVGVSSTAKPDEILIIVANPSDPVEKTFINDGYTIVENGFGQIYRVLERYTDNPATPIPEDQIIRLDRKWQGGNAVWVVPPPAGGGRYPCVAVYQKVIRF